jgi:uncharacterized membrane protein YcaP (DUF421 family)
MLNILIPLTDPLETILRAAIIYFALLFAFRIVGKHEFGQLSPFDLILLLLISESVSEALSSGDDSLTTGLISAATLIVMNVLLSLMKYKSKRMRDFLEASPQKLIDNGTVIDKNLHRELMTREDLREALRTKGIERFEDVKVSYMESDGEISAILYRPDERQREIQETTVHESREVE